MSQHRERNILTELIQKYKTMDFMWKKDHKMYSNKAARKQVYEELLRIYWKFDENADLKSVKKKFDNLRTNYMREHKKVIQSIKDNEDFVYQPSLWYYDLMGFLNESNCDVSDTPRTKATETSSVCSENSNSSDLIQFIPPRPSSEPQQSSIPQTSHVDKSRFLEVSFQTNHDPLNTIETSGVFNPRPRTEPNHSSMLNDRLEISQRQRIAKKRRMVDPTYQSDTYVGNRHARDDKDEFDIYGQYVASELRLSHPTAALKAKRIINSILISLRLGKLEDNAKLVRRTYEPEDTDTDITNGIKIEIIEDIGS